MNYAALIEAIEEVVKTNGNKEITGANLQAVLVTMVRSLGANYTFAGVATPATSAGTPDQNVFYIGGAGTYANFGSSITIPKGSIGVFAYNGSWSNTAISVDLPTYININELVNHPAAYANAATALADVPAIYRRKGVKCVYYDDTTELWIEMLCYDDAGGANWWTDVENNWVIEGPIKTKIPSATGGQQLNIGGEKRGNLDDVLNVNVWNENIYPYGNAALARAAVPANKRKLGAIITYLLDDGWFTDQFIGNNISNWGTASNWRAVGPVSVSQNSQTGIKIGTITIGQTTTDIYNGSNDVKLSIASTLDNSAVIAEDGRIYTNSSTAPQSKVISFAVEPNTIIKINHKSPNLAVQFASAALYNGATYLGYLGLCSSNIDDNAFVIYNNYGADTLKLTIHKDYIANAQVLQSSDVKIKPFGSSEIADGAITLSKISPSIIDATPTTSSNNLVKSGGVKSAIDSVELKAEKASSVIQYDVNIDISSMTPNKGLDSQGKAAAADWAYLDEKFYPIMGDGVLDYKLRGSTGPVYIICFYTDADDNTFISGVDSPLSEQEGSVTIPSTAKYFRYCTTNFTGKYIKYTPFTIKEINNLDDWKAINETDLITLVTPELNGYGINGSGQVTPYDWSYMTARYFPVLPYSPIYYHLRKLYGGKIIAFYTDTNESSYIGGINATGDEQEGVVYVPYNAKYMRFCSVEWSNHSIKIGLLAAAQDIYNSKDLIAGIMRNTPSTKEMAITISSEQTLDVSEVSPCCTFLSSRGKKIKGNGNATITLTFSATTKTQDVISFGIKIPYSTQDIATINIAGASGTTIIGTPQTTNKTTSGKGYKIQGETYQRVNLIGGISSTTIVVTSATNWELWITDKAVVNDNMPKTPVIYVYDGGHWDGHVTYNNVDMSIWSLHRLLGIPYTISCTPNETMNMQQEVLDDIDSGFADVITRIGSGDNYYIGDEAQIIDKIADATASCNNGDCADNREIGTLAVNVFDKDSIKCIKGANIKVLRMYPFNDKCEKFGVKYNDYDIMMVVPNSVSNPNWHTRLLGFPIMLWAHGVGTPQSPAEQELIDYYESGPGAVTAFERLLTEINNGKAVALKASDWMAYVKRYS